MSNFALLKINMIEWEGVRIKLDENFIGALKIRISYGAIQFIYLSPCKVIALNLLCFIFDIFSLLLSFIFLSLFFAIKEKLFTIAFKNEKKW